MVSVCVFLFMWSAFLFVILLLCSNIFMNYAWYGHLKQTDSPLYKAIFISWGIAFWEYCFQVPANRFGYTVFNLTQLKIVQEVISIAVFMVFSVIVLKEEIKWNYIVAFGLILLAIFFVFKKW